MGAPLLLARLGDRELAYVADADDGVIFVADAEGLSPISALAVGGAPEQIVLARSGRLFATVRDKNTLVAIGGTGMPGDPMRIVGRAATRSEPIGLAMTPDESTLLVTAGWGHALEGYDPVTLTSRFDVDLDREPRAVVASDDGLRAFVSHAVGPDVDVVNLFGSHESKHIPMGVRAGPFHGESQPPGPEGPVQLHVGQGFALARSVLPAGRVFVPHARIRTVIAEGTSGGYGSAEEGPTEEFDVGVFDEDTGAPVGRSLSSGGGLSCVLPRAAVTTSTGQLLVACLGTGEIVAMDAAAANPHEAVIQRWSVPGGPTGIAVDDGRPRALVWSQFDHALTWILLQGQDGFVVTWSKLPRRASFDEAIGRGRALFHLSDKRISLDGRACASCHPDGRDDGLVWSTPDGPRNPPMLAGRLNGAEPYGWLGEADDVPTHLKVTFGRLGAKTGKKGLARNDVGALVAYVLSMKPPVVERGGALDPLVAEGKRIYESTEAGCGGCHGNAGLSPDGQRHNVLSWSPGDRNGVFDTPSLRFVAGTAPYFHDGRYPTLHSLLTHTRKSMGQDRSLSSSQLDALEAYVRTL